MEELGLEQTWCFNGLTSVLAPSNPQSRPRNSLEMKISLQCSSWDLRMASWNRIPNSHHNRGGLALCRAAAVQGFLMKLWAPWPSGGSYTHRVLQSLLLSLLPVTLGSGLLSCCLRKYVHKFLDTPLCKRWSLIIVPLSVLWLHWAMVINRTKPHTLFILPHSECTLNPPTLSGDKAECPEQHSFAVLCSWFSFPACENKTSEKQQTEYLQSHIHECPTAQEAEMSKRAHIN